MTNKLGDLTDHLFAQLDRLSKENLSSEELEREVDRADAIVKVSDQITSNAELQLKAAKLFAEHGKVVLPHLPQIGSSKE